MCPPTSQSAARRPGWVGLEKLLNEEQESGQARTERRKWRAAHEQNWATIRDGGRGLSARGTVSPTACGLEMAVWIYRSTLSGIHLPGWLLGMEGKLRSRKAQIPSLSISDTLIFSIDIL